MHLAQRGRGGGLALQHAEDLLNRLAQLRFNDRNHVVERFGRNFVLERGQYVQCLLRQEISTRTEKLTQLDEQHAQLDRGLAKRDQHVDQHFNVWLHIVIAPFVSTYDTPPLSINDPERPQQQARNSQEAHDLRKSIDTRNVACHKIERSFLIRSRYIVIYVAKWAEVEWFSCLFCWVELKIFVPLILLTQHHKVYRLDR